MRNIISYHVKSNVTMTNLQPDILIQISISTNIYKYKWQMASYNQENCTILMKPQVRNVIWFHKISTYKYEILNVECWNHRLSIHHPHHLSTIITYHLVLSISFSQCSSNSLITLYKHASTELYIFLYLHCPLFLHWLLYLAATWQYPHDLLEQHS